MDARENQPAVFVLGVEDFYPLDESDDLMALGRLKGSITTGDAVYISNLGVDHGAITVSVIKEIKLGPEIIVEQAADTIVGLRIENGKTAGIRKGTVIYSRNATMGQVHNAYVNSVGNAYIGRKKLALSPSEIEALSITDCAEILRLFSLVHTQDKDESEEKKKENKQKAAVIEAALAKKLLITDEFYCVYSKNTGEPYLFSETVKQGEGYECTPPYIWIFTEAYGEMMKYQFKEDCFEIKKITKGESGDTITNFLGSTFYLNGAEGVRVINENVALSAELFIPKPDYSNEKPQDIPVTNPDLERWLLLMGQMDELKSDQEKLAFKLYFRFCSMEIKKARLLIPMKTDMEVPENAENGSFTFTKGTTLQMAQRDGKYGRPAILMYTDWKHLRMSYGEDWNGLVETVEHMISLFDCVINVTDHVKAGCYIDKEVYQSMM